MSKPISPVAIGGFTVGGIALLLVAIVCLRRRTVFTGR